MTERINTLNVLIFELQQLMSILRGVAYFGWPRVLEIPEFNMAVANCDKVWSIFGEGHSFDFGRHFVWSYFNATPPVPYIDDHVMLRTDRNNVFVIGRKGLFNQNKSFSRKAIWIKILND